MKYRLTLPLTSDGIDLLYKLRAGDEVLLDGHLYTGRDAAHKRFIEALEKGEELPINLANGFIYYTGPTPASPGDVIGSAGPTTSYRMDAYTPLLLEKSGLKGMIGKGDRAEAVYDSVIANKAVYFAAIGGAGALMAQSIVAAEVVAYDDLGPEAVRLLEVKGFPVYVAIDTLGNSIYRR